MSDDQEFSISAMRRKRHETSGQDRARHNGHDSQAFGSNGNGHYHANGNGHGNGHSHATFEEETRKQGSNGNSQAWSRPNPQWEEMNFKPRAALPYSTTTSEPLPADPSFRLPFDPWRLVTGLKQRWTWLIAGGVLLAVAGFLAAAWLIGYKVPVHLMRKGASNAMSGSESAEPFRLRELSEGTLLGLMKSPEVLRRVGAAVKPPVSPSQLNTMVKIAPAANPDFVTITVSGRDQRQMVDIANAFADEVVRYTRELQSLESGDVNNYLKRKLALVEADYGKVNEELVKFSKESEFLNFEKETEAYLAQMAGIDLRYETARIDFEIIDLKIESLQRELKRQSPVNEKLQAAKDELANLKLKYTDAHPLVQSALAKLEALEKQPQPQGTNQNSLALTPLGNSLYMQLIDLQNQKVSLRKQLDEFSGYRAKVQGRISGLSEKAVRYADIKSRLQALDSTRGILTRQQREAQLFVDNALGYYKVFAPATLKDVDRKKRWLKVFMITGAALLLGILGAALTAMIAEVADTRLKTAADVTRVTNLPVLASLGDLTKMDAAEQVNWAFRTLTILKGKLNISNQGMVCGFISSKHGEGRSTWINLLVSAASQRGLRVLTVDTRPTSAAPETKYKDPESHEQKETSMTTNLLATPSQVADQLTDPHSQPVVHIPLPGWVWNLERRKQWQSALAHWRKIDNLVLFVELPPASQPEAVLLAENLPQLIWLTGSGKANAVETTSQLETLRHAGCNIVGAVLNQEPVSFWRRQLDRFRPQFAAAVLALSMTLAQAAEPEVQLASAQPAAANTNLFLRQVDPRHRAPWQQRLTLGPGDALDISLFGHAELMRTNIVVGPDGTLTYLQAQDLKVSGLTIDELRTKLDEELGKYYRAARVIVNPVTFNSKKYFVLGKVNSKGAYPLDRPITILEAVARAKGLETGLYERQTVELADLSRSFLIRQGQKAPVDFEKLFLHGDLSQNIPLEPGDYLYFPSASQNEIYVLGEVMSPGVLGFVPNATIVRALADRGGFSPRAWKKKVLVIRGSLTNPETFAIDVSDILTAKQPDFKLQPTDIVYVSARPWIKIEELLDTAAETFIQSAVTTVTGLKVGPIIKDPIVE